MDMRRGLHRVGDPSVLTSWPISRISLAVENCWLVEPGTLG